MDWYLPPDHGAASQLREEVRLYLERHSAPDTDVAGAVLAFSELLTNAIEHSGHDVWVSLDWTARKPTVTIHDIGPDFEVIPTVAGIDQIQGRGLMIASHLTEELRVASKRAGGNRVSAVLDVERREMSSHDPPTRIQGRLPELDEARSGFFEREAFLRALVVELAQSVDLQHGPSAAEAAIAQVGANVGARMEDSYRAHDQVEGPLKFEQIADFCVDLKRAINGDFYIISADAERIVLGNRRCPFGDVVRRAPSLCRMTSSVFGGIAARNTGNEVAVHLEERIAVGDPECRVTIWLSTPPAESAPFVHHYSPRQADD